ncbi:MAG: microviridin/marinostatin family tricyclic proteinase inhibitor [Methylococcaceae bacterium]|nr:microviridin/marinostatin family tricyclic proteinase inhibitor [Methylococcaceae bacterium]
MMSDVKIENLAPQPFFARFLESQHGESMSHEEMARIRGGVAYVTQAYPSDRENAPSGGLPEWMADFIQKIGGQPGCFPHHPDLSAYLPKYPDPQGSIVTQAAPSDNEIFGDLT